MENRRDSISKMIINFFENFFGDADTQNNNGKISVEDLTAKEREELNKIEKERKEISRRNRLTPIGESENEKAAAIAASIQASSDKKKSEIDEQENKRKVLADKYGRIEQKYPRRPNVRSEANTRGREEGR